MKALNLSPAGGPGKKKSKKVGGTKADKVSDEAQLEELTGDQAKAIARYNADRADRGGKGFHLRNDTAGYAEYEHQLSKAKRYKDDETNLGSYGPTYVGKDKDGTEFIGRGNNIFAADAGGNVTKGKRWGTQHGGDQYGKALAELNGRDLAIPGSKESSIYNSNSTAFRVRALAAKAKQNRLNPLKSIK